MTADQEVLARSADLAARGWPHVLITVIRAQGSTPRNPGAKMLWMPNGTTDHPVGTVGGGQFEMLVMGDAEKHLRAGTCGVERYVLGADADQCCGGVMEVFFEPHAPARQVVIFGAGHVCAELVRLLSPAPLRLAVVDDRPDWNTAARFPQADRILSYEEGVARACERPEATLACVMTCSHDTDFELLRALLTRPPAFVGLIGSRSKRACLFGRLVASGVPPEAVERVHCPLGVGDTGKEPPLVAVSIAAQLLLEAPKLARL
jgi:xanthine dehydrogenase accessory factor